MRNFNVLISVVFLFFVGAFLMAGTGGLVSTSSNVDASLLVNMNASSIASGTLNAARLPATVPQGMSFGASGTTCPSSFNVTVNGGANISATGDGGIFVANYSTNFFNSGTSVFLASMGMTAGGSPVLLDASAFSIATINTNMLEELNAGCGILVGNSSTSLKGYGVCSPGASTFDTGNYAYEWSQWVGTKQWGVPKWVPGVYQPDGTAYNFVVSGVTVTPTSPTIYTNSAGGIFVVNSTTISGGAGGINTSARGVSPAASGALGKLSIAGRPNVGDNTITYSSFTTATWLWSMACSPSAGTLAVNYGENLTGVLTVNGATWTSGFAGNSNKINGAAIDPNFIIQATNFTSVAPQGGTSFSWAGNATMSTTGGGDLTWGDGGGELFRVGHNDSYFRIDSALALGFRTDGGNNIGSTDGSAVGRPNNAYIKTTVFAGSSVVVGAITNTASFTLVNTNWISGQLYTNQTGRPIFVLVDVVLLDASTGVSGAAVMRLETNGAQMYQVSFGPALTVSVTDRKQISGFIAPGVAFDFTNLSSGTGNTATLSGGQYMVY